MFLLGHSGLIYIAIEHIGLIYFTIVYLGLIYFSINYLGLIYFTFVISKLNQALIGYTGFYFN